jgi:hydrogenase maturation protease
MTILIEMAVFLPCSQAIKQQRISQLVKKIMNRKITILGIGNTLFSDEGVGIHLLPLLREALSDYEDVEIIEGLTDGMRLLGPVEAAEYLIIIDAINAGKVPGTIITLVGDEIPAYFGIKMSVHQLGFQEVLMAAKLRERYPKEIVMFGMQPYSLELGVELTDTIQQNLGALRDVVLNQVNYWRQSYETA